MAKEADETVGLFGATVLERRDTVKELPRWGLRSPALAIVYGLTLGALALVALLSVYSGVPVAFSLRDPTATLGAHPLTGVLSNVGVLVWCAAAGICFFTRAILPRAPGNDEMRSFLRWSGLLTTVLLLDDLFLFHESLAPDYLGLRQRLVFLSYGIATAWYLARFRRIVLGREVLVLLAALVFFTGSVFVDALQERWPSPWRILFEDGFKLLGIVSWSAYLIRTGARAASASVRER